MARMKYVEASIGKDDSPARISFAQQCFANFLLRKNLALKMVIDRPQGLQDVVARDDLGADTTDFDSRSEIRHRGRGRETQAADCEETKKRQHHVSGTGDVVDFARRC